MTTEEREIVSTLFLRTIGKTGVASSDYKPFGLGMPDWCPCCVRKEENRKSLSLKQPHGNPVNKKAKKQKENMDRFPFDIDVGDLSEY